MGVQLTSSCKLAPAHAYARRGATAPASRPMPGRIASRPTGGRIAVGAWGNVRPGSSRGGLGIATRSAMPGRGEGGGEESRPGISDEDISRLLKRVMEYRDANAEIPVMTLECILPRQQMQVLFPWGGEWIGILGLIRGSTNTFGMVGTSITTRKPVEWGTEVEVLSVEESEDGLLVEIVGRRRFTVKGPGREVAGVALSEVQWCGEEDRPAELSEAVAKAASLRCLVREWERLVCEGGHERRPGHLTSVKQALGPMPSLDEPDACAMWAAALINPPTKLGVAYEIRPKVLGAQTVMERLDIVSRNYTLSIKHLNGTRPLF